MSNWQSTCEKCGERYYDSDGHDCKGGDCTLCKHARDGHRCQISIDDGFCNNYDKWEPKKKCNKCIYYFNGIGANPCETCNDFNNYQEKSMEKNEKFEEFKKFMTNKFGKGWGSSTYSDVSMSQSFEAGQESMKPTQSVFNALMSDLPERSDHQTPNCYKCRYTGIVNYFGIGSIKQCMAQADKPAEDVYNNDQCQALYEVEEVE